MRGYFWVMVALLVSCPSARAEESRAQNWLHLNGYTHHFDAPGTNDNLFGLGLTRYVGNSTAVMQAWEADAFQDSARKLSGYAGYSLSYHFRYVHPGLTAAIMYHRNFRRENRWRILPVGLPFVELSLRYLAVRAYYVPPWRRPSDSQIAFQLLVPFGR